MAPRLPAVERLTYTLPQAAQALGIGSDVARRLATLGELPTIRIGSRVLVPRAGLERWLEENTGRQLPGRAS